MKIQQLIEKSSEEINNGILNHNLKGDFGTTIKKVQKSNYTKPPKKDKHPTHGSDVELFKEDINELEYPAIDGEDEKTTKGPVTAQVVYVDENGDKKTMLNSSYADVDRLKRVFTNFYKLVLQPNIQNPKPYVNSYSKTGLTAVVEDGDNVGYVVKINNLKSFDEVKAFYVFVDQLFTEG